MRHRARDLALFHAAADGLPPPAPILWAEDQKRADGAHARDVVRAREGARIDEATAMLLAKTACLGADAAASATHALVVAAVGAARLRADLAAKDAETEVGPDFAARLPFAAANLRLPRTAEAVGARVERARRAQARAADDHLVRIDSIVPRAHACHLCQVSLCCYWAPPTRAGARRRRGAWRRKPLGVGDRALSLDRAFMASRFKI